MDKWFGVHRWVRFIITMIEPQLADRLIATKNESRRQTVKSALSAQKWRPWAAAGFTLASVASMVHCMLHVTGAID